MPYVSRNSQGIIVEAHDSPMNRDMSWLEHDNPELGAFLAQTKVVQQARLNLATTDLDMARVIEDLVDVLISKNIFIFTELPVPVQEKLSSRKQLRADMCSLTNLIGDDEGIF